ncbi:hypothetical protein GEMRC1_005789 [Eukaryota sp. GEM-RC1]
MNRRFSTAKSEFECKRNKALDIAQKKLRNALHEQSLQHGLEVVAVDKAFGLKQSNHSEEVHSPRGGSPRPKPKVRKPLSASPFVSSGSFVKKSKKRY